MSDQQKFDYLLGKFTRKAATFVGTILFFGTIELVCLAHIFLR
jgi:hypothetical protein